MGDVAIFMAIWPILRPFGIFYGHLVYLIHRLSLPIASIHKQV
jgi:hypothetical protein